MQIYVLTRNGESITLHGSPVSPNEYYLEDATGLHKLTGNIITLLDTMQSMGWELV